MLLPGGFIRKYTTAFQSRKYFVRRSKDHPVHLIHSVTLNPDTPENSDPEGLTPCFQE